MNKSQLETLLRVEYLNSIQELLSKQYETDVLPVSANELAIPCVDAEGNEKWIVVKVSTPRGARNGEGGYIPYDGYALAEAYKMECEDKAQEKAEKQAMKEKEKENKKKKKD